MDTLKKLDLEDLINSNNYIEVRNKIDIIMERDGIMEESYFKNTGNIVHISAKKKMNLKPFKDIL